MARSNSNRPLQLLPIAVGILAGGLLAANRLLTPQITDWQARSDATGILACAVLILTGLLWQRVQPKPPDAVEPEGNRGFELAEDLDDRLKTELAWASHLLLTNTVTCSVVAYWRDRPAGAGESPQGRTILRRGVLGPVAAVREGPILQRAIARQRAIYLVDVKAYPGRVEFDYLPPNIQGIIVQPLGEAGALVLGANAPRSYTNQDERWIEGIADKLADTLAAIAPTQDGEETR